MLLLLLSLIPYCPIKCFARKLGFYLLLGTNTENTQWPKLQRRERLDTGKTQKLPLGVVCAVDVPQLYGQQTRIIVLSHQRFRGH